MQRAVAAGGSPPTGEETIVRPREFGSLVHRVGRLRGTVHGFADSDVVMIGRGTHNDVRFDLFEDATVSTCHAEIRYEGGRFILYDLGSLNGTFLNGRPIRRISLRPGDDIGLGRQGPVLRFKVEDEDVTPATGAKERTSSSAAAAPTTEEVHLPDDGRRLRRIERALHVLIGLVGLDVLVRLFSSFR